MLLLQGCTQDTGEGAEAMEVEEDGGEESSTQKSVTFLLITKFSKEVSFLFDLGFLLFFLLLSHWKVALNSHHLNHV